MNGSRLEEFIEALEDYGAPGLFVIAFISNYIPGFPAIYLTIIGTYGAITGELRSNIIAIIAAGVGAGLGKTALFLTSRAIGSASATIRRKREEGRELLRVAGKGILVSVFLFAALPLPDDILYIPLGLAGYKLLPFAASVIAGKIVLTSMAYGLGRAYQTLFKALTESPIEANLGTLIVSAIAASLAFTALMLSINWRLVLEEYRAGGWVRGLKALLIEVVSVVTLKKLRRARKG